MDVFGSRPVWNPERQRGEGYMCHYITATLPARADFKAAEAIFKCHGFGFAENDNPNLSSQLEKGDRQFLTAGKYCDCGTSLGSYRVDARPAVSKRELDQLRRKGWSEAKINRWLEEKAAASEKDRRGARPELAGTDRELVRWFAMMDELFQSGAADRVGILLHDYSGSVASEKISLSATETHSLAESTPLVLGELAEDLLCVFTK
jgi:hypothetical protein